MQVSLFRFLNASGSVSGRGSWIPGLLWLQLYPALSFIWMDIESVVFKVLQGISRNCRYSNLFGHSCCQPNSIICDTTVRSKTLSLYCNQLGTEHNWNGVHRKPFCCTNTRVYSVLSPYGLPAIVLPHIYVCGGVGASGKFLVCHLLCQWACGGVSPNCVFISLCLVSHTLDSSAGLWLV